MRECALFDSPACRAISCTLEKNAVMKEKGEICKDGELHIFTKKEVEKVCDDLISAHERDGYELTIHALMRTQRQYYPHIGLDADDFSIMNKKLTGGEIL